MPFFYVWSFRKLWYMLEKGPNTQRAKMTAGTGRKEEICLSILFICYPRCTTCQKTKKWLEEGRISYQARDIQTQNPTFFELKEWWAKSGLPLKKLFNTSGLKYKEMHLAQRLPEMSDEEKLKPR